jgi:HEPN domain-containing protein
MDQLKYRQESDRWYQQSVADLSAARNSLASGNYEWSCFQAQQAGEKALKSLWLFHAGEPWGHSLVKLVIDFPVAGLKQALERFENPAKRLDKLYIPTRYPNGLPDMIPAQVYTAAEAEAAIKDADWLLAEIRKMMQG